MKATLVTPVTPGGTSNTRAKSEHPEPYARKGVTRGDGVTGLGITAPAAVHLDSESVEAVARRVVEMLSGTDAAGLIDAAELARRLGCSRDTVYRNADRLGAVRVGDGKRARLRFDPSVSIGRGGAAAPAPAGSRRRARTSGASNVELLPIGCRRAA